MEKVWDAKGNCVGEKHFFSAVDKDDEVYTVNDCVKVRPACTLLRQHSLTNRRDNDHDQLHQIRSTRHRQTVTDIARLVGIFFDTAGTKRTYHSATRTTSLPHACKGLPLHGGWLLRPDDQGAASVVLRASRCRAAGAVDGTLRASTPSLSSSLCASCLPHGGGANIPSTSTTTSCCIRRPTPKRPPATSSARYTHLCGRRR